MKRQTPANTPHSTFDIALCTDTTVVLLDRDMGRSITNDADLVIPWLNEHLAGGLGKRRVFYRDTSQTRFDELKVENGCFAGFVPCSESQQIWLSGLINPPIRSEQIKRAPCEG